VLLTLMHALGFPARMFSYWGLVYWIPAMSAFVLVATKREWMTRFIFPLAAAVWCLGQILVISLGRSEVAPRYYDIFMVGILANGCVALEMVRHSWVQPRVRNAVVAGFVLWLSAVGYKTFESTAEHTRGDIPVLATQATQQVSLVARYYAEQRNADVLRSRPFPVRPFPEVDFLDDTLRRPEIAALWPPYVLTWRPNDQLRQLPWLGKRITRESWFRGALLAGIVAVVILYVTILWTLLEKGGRRDDLPAGT